MAAVQRHLLGLLVALAAGELLLWRLGRPALWLDESASMVATQRSWPDLWMLLRGTDAPLVPYYAVLKLLSGLTTALHPAAAHHPEVLLRWPSVVAMALAAWVLTVWVERRAGTATALATAAMLLLAGGFSRYGQEARPYGCVVLAAVVCTLAWSRVTEDPRPRYVVGYAVSVMVLGAANPLAVSLVVAHLVAAFAVADPRPGAEWGRPVLDTLLGGAAGLLLALPLAVTMAANGGGASSAPELTPVNLWTAFSGLFAAEPVPWLASAVLLLALLGAVRAARPGPVAVRPDSVTFVARTALTWAIVPPLVLLPAVAARPNLLIGRYLMFTLPGWVVLAGLGVVTVGETVGAVLARRVPRWGAAAPLAGVAGAALVVGAVAVAQAPTLTGVRTVSGHGEDIRPVLALAGAGPVAGLPIVVGSRMGAIELPAYAAAMGDPGLEQRMVGFHAQRDETVIWPDSDPTGVRRRVLRDDGAVVLLTRATASSTCPDTPGMALITRIDACLPSPLPQLGFRVASAHEPVASDGHGWVFALLTRTTPDAGKAPGTGVDHGAGE